MATKKTKSLNEIELGIQKLHGDQAMYHGEDPLLERHPRISTGIIELDDITGGGFAKGKIVDLYGPESSGKSGIAMKFLAEAQKEGVCVFIDLENAYDPDLAEINGVDTDTLRVVHLEAAEDVLQLIIDLAMTGEVSAVVIDSFAGLVPAAELAGDIGDSHVGLIGRLASQTLRILTKKMPANKSETIIVFVNQLRANIGAFGSESKHTVTGGRAVKFYATTRVNVSRYGQIKQGDEIVGHTVKIKTDKSRLHPQSKTAMFDVVYGVGILNEATILDRCVAAGIVKKSGSWYSVAETGEAIGQGRLGSAEALRENPDMCAELWEQLVDPDEASEDEIS